MFKKSWLLLSATMILMIIVVVVNVNFGFAADNVKFTDVNGHWGESNIQALVDINGISGYGDGTFRPDKSITYAEFITILMQGLQERSIPPLEKEVWYSGSVAEATNRGIIVAGDVDQADMNKPISRYIMALWMDRAAPMEQHEPKLVQ